MSDNTGIETGLEIAVTGMAGRFPGARNIDEYWENLSKGKEGVTFFSREQLERSGLPPAMLNDPAFVPANGSMPDADVFDAAFFGYSPREVEVLDPGVRVFHEVAWHAMEDAAVVPGTFKGLIGLYAGASSNIEWLTYTVLSDAGNRVDPFMAGHLKERCFMCLHVSYRLNLRGPSVAVSTSCSTSLTAIILACQALLSGECDIALAGGSSVRLPMERGYVYKEGMIASPDGHCRAFDAKAAGTLSGNGAGVVVLKLLEKAREDRDRVYAVIKGSAINNDGDRKAGFTAPSIDGQAEVIRTALRMADVSSDSITYVESHGTGTILGDPVEIEALKMAFDSDRKQYCGIGSVKSNIGHLDSAAGAAGFIKAVLAIHHRAIPPSLHFETPNPKIDFENSPFYVNTQLKEWLPNEYPLRAGVSSFGIGGTNAHLILEQAPADTAYIASEPGSHPHLLLLSARTGNALERVTRNFETFLEKKPSVSLADAAYTLKQGRKRFPHRRSIVCRDVKEALEGLSNPGFPGRRSFYSTHDKRPVIFMFPGQGAQYENMALGLYENLPVFREAMDQCFQILSDVTREDLKPVLYPAGAGTGLINRTHMTQPLIFAVEYALAKTLNALGITPYAMIGHSIGEYVAAHLSGVFSLEDALHIVALRGRLMQKMPGGGMLSVAVNPDDLLSLLPGDVSIAAVNTPDRCTVSGPEPSLARLEEQLKQRGLEPRHLVTSHAFHSAMMDPVLDEFQSAVGTVTLDEPRIPYISNLTGQWITVEQAVDPAYWTKHLRHTVRFADGMSSLLGEEHAVFIEAGPGNALSTFAAKHPAKTAKHSILNLLRHPKEKTGDYEFLLNRIGQLWLYGQDIRTGCLTIGEKPRKTRLPLYPFEKQHFPMSAVMEELPTAKSNPLARNENFSRWFYQVSWKQKDLPFFKGIQPGTVKSDYCLIFDSGQGHLSRWEPYFRGLGVRVIGVGKGDAFAAPAPLRYIIDPAQPEHYQQLLKHLSANRIQPQWIIHGFSLSGGEPGEPEDIDRSLTMGYASLICLARAIGEFLPDNPIDLVILSDGMQTVWNEPTRFPGKAALLGPSLTIPGEYSHVACSSIDIEPGFAGKGDNEGDTEVMALVRKLAAEMAAGLPDRVVAYRGGTRWVQTEESLPLEQKAPPLPRRIKTGGVYLVTGGLGGIGLTLARYLAEHAGAKLVLTGRTALPPRAQWQERLDSKEPREPSEEKTANQIANVLEIEKLGGEVMTAAADTTDLARMEAVVREAVQRFGTINGVIHAAGTGGSGIIQLQDPMIPGKALDAKIHGTLVLEKIFRDTPLDFIVFCSSLASFSAAPGQVDYTAANRFLDAFARSRQIRQAGHSFAVSINWGTWQDIGMAVDAVKEMGLDPRAALTGGFNSPEGVEAFARIMEEDQPQVIVCSRNQVVPPRQPRDTEPPKGTRTGGGSGKDSQAKKSYQRPELSTEYIAPETVQEKKVAELVSQISGVDRVGIYDNFFELGLTSVDVINMNNRLKTTPGLTISTVIIFEKPTVHALAQYIVSSIAPGDKPTAKPGKKDRSKTIDSGKNRLMNIKKKARPGSKTK